MKDRHLYRGQRVDNGEWVYGYYFVYLDKHLIQTPEVEIIAWDNEVNYQEWGNPTFEIIPDTLGQNTTAININNKSIYDGDILSYGKLQPDLIVCFNKKRLAYCVKNEDGTFAGCLEHYLNAEITGSIHDKE